MTVAKETAVSQADMYIPKEEKKDRPYTLFTESTISFQEWGLRNFLCA